MTTVYDYLSQDLYAIGSQTPSGNLDSASASMASMATVTTGSGGSTTYGDQIQSGEVDGELTFTGGFIQSKNFVSGTSGWRLSADGTLEAVNAILSGSIAATTGTIGGFEIGADYIKDVANSFGMSSTVTGGDDIRFWAGATYANRATAPFQVYESGKAIFKNVQVGGSTLQYTITDDGIFSYGDGSDGAYTLNGAQAAVAGLFSKSGSDFTLLRDAYFTTLTIDSTFTLNPNGYRVFCSVVLVINGALFRNGNDGGDGHDAGLNVPPNGDGGSAGGALSDGYLKGSIAGSTGGGGGANGPGSVGSNGGNTTNSIGDYGAVGGEGGRIGVGFEGGTGGTGGTATESNVKLIANWHLSTLLDVGSTGATVKFDNGAAGGGGGGGGCNDGANKGAGGGGSGSSGGIVAIYSRTITVGASGIIQANGGVGGAGGDTAGATTAGGGGGAGGNGGQIILVYNVYSNTGTVEADGGIGGAAGSGGTAGTPDAGSSGNAGTIRLFNLSL